MIIKYNALGKYGFLGGGGGINFHISHTIMQLIYIIIHWPYNMSYTAIITQKVF